MKGFRMAAPTDAAELVTLVRSAYRGEASREGWTSEADLVSGDRIDEAQVLDAIERPGSMMLVLDEDDGVLACCRLEDRGDSVAFFGTFAVAPKAQGRGVGRRVMAEAERLVADAFGASVLEMTVLAQQTALILWYERLGFQRTGETRRFPADPRHAVPQRDDLYFVVLRKHLERRPGPDRLSFSSPADPP
jgi:ribosomal protein S18 acetylase RimI-like enzyme